MEYLPTGLNVHRRPDVDSKALLERRRNLLDGTEFADIDARKRHEKRSRVARLTIARPNRVSHENIDKKHAALNRVS